MRAELISRALDAGKHIYCEKPISDDLDAAIALHTWIARTEGLPAVRDIVPAARSVLLDGVDVASWRAVLGDQRIQRMAAASGDDVVIPVRYDGADLEVIADAWHCSVEDVVARHQAADFVVAICGFAPGFAYCTALPRLPTVPRRAEPRPRVPAGSVAVAGEFCGMYPNEMPGGWQLLGTTDAALFDVTRSRPALLQPGDRVRFEAVR
jgi:KipI family sensor histidine kinase inhibitor